MPVGASVSLHADGSDIRQKHDRALPDLLVETGGGEFGASNRIRLPKQLQAVAGDLADNADAEAWPGERLAAHDHLGQSELTPNRPHLVLEQGAERLDERELQVFGQAAHIVMTLDVRSARTTTRFDNIRVERALHQKVDRRAIPRRFSDEISGRSLEGADEFAPDDLALGLRVAHTGERVQKLFDGIDGHESYPGGGDVVFLDLATLVLAQQPVIHEDADELIADGPVHHRRGYRRVHSAGEPTNYPCRADLGPDSFHLLGDNVSTVPVGGDPGGIVQKVFEHALAELGVLHLRVPLHPVHPLLVARKRRNRGGCARRQHGEALWRLRHRVTVTHPGGLLGRLVAQKRRRAGRERDGGGAIFAKPRVGDLASELLRHHLEAVTDAEGRDAELQDARVESRRSDLVDTRGASAQHDSGRVEGGDLSRRDRVRHDLGIDVGLTHPAGDQLGVLGAEVDDEYRPVVGFAACRANDSLPPRGRPEPGQPVRARRARGARDA
jgi:hypothetical protein